MVILPIYWDAIYRTRLAGLDILHYIGHTLQTLRSCSEAMEIDWINISDKTFFSVLSLYTILLGMKCTACILNFLRCILLLIEVFFVTATYITKLYTFTFSIQYLSASEIYRSCLHLLCSSQLKRFPALEALQRSLW